MDESQRWQPWRLGQLWRLWRLAHLWRLWRLTQARWVRPLLGVLAALALILGGMTLMGESDPTRPGYIDTAPIIKPLPTDQWPSQGN